ncbi:hypothetical protein ACIQXA_32085 [Streptomyces massasporeus]|uniref:hypothetical protein n=1 Tax=Streptomyces massasporeus TaxID=67324 RepID=UPI0038056181
MDFNRRTTMTAELGTMPAEGGLTARPTEPGTVTVQGESAARTNIPVVRGRRAAGSRYPGLRATEKPPARTGWYATYTVRARQAGVYTLIPEATAPVETPHTEAASYLHLSVNDGPCTEIARPQPHLYGSRAAWGDLPERVRCPYLAARRGPLHRTAPLLPDGVQGPARRTATRPRRTVVAWADAPA